MFVEFVVVQTQIHGNADYFEFVSMEVSRHSSLYAAKRAGLRYFDHDDFNIAVLENGKLARWTWMGEDIDEAPEDFEAIAERLGWEVAK